ncbi:hypothetical protein ACFLWC_03455 [Chloroflexota bacterium]
MTVNWCTTVSACSPFYEDTLRPSMPILPSCNPAEDTWKAAMAEARERIQSGDDRQEVMAEVLTT